MPASGDIVHVGNAASVQFGEGRHFLFRVIRVMQPETRNTYTDWAWLEGYQLGEDGNAIERREIYVKPAGLRHIPAKPAARPAACRTNTRPRVPRPRTAPDNATTVTTRSAR